MSRPVTYPNTFGSLSGNVSASLLDQNFNAAGSIINDSASGWVNAALDTGSANSYVVTLVPPAVTYSNGFYLSWIPLNQNTGPSSINVNGLGNIPILKADASALTTQTLIPGTIYSMVCINNAFRIVSPDVSVLVGDIKMFGGATPPSNWLICNGTAVSRAVYPALFGVIGIAFGPGNGSTTFNVPNFGGRLPAGATAGTIGAFGGTSTTALSVANMPAHNHVINVSISDPGHAHTYVSPTGGFAAAAGSGQFSPQSTANTGSSFTGITASASSGATGSGAAFSILPPFLNVNFIIRAF